MNLFWKSHILHIGTMYFHNYQVAYHCKSDHTLHFYVPFSTRPARGTQCTGSSGRQYPAEQDRIYREEKRRSAENFKRTHFISNRIICICVQNFVTNVLVGRDFHSIKPSTYHKHGTAYDDFHTKWLGKSALAASRGTPHYSILDSLRPRTA